MRSPLLAHRFALALILVPWLATTARGQSASVGETEIARDGFVIVFAEDAHFAPEKAKKLLERVKAAYDFVKEDQHWTNTEVLSHDLAVHVLTDAHMKERHKGASGSTHGSHAFVIGESFLDQASSEETLAHELTHLQDHRHLVKKGTKLPHYLTEGRAIDTSRRYCAKLGVSTAKEELSAAYHLTLVTAERAREILKDKADVPEMKLEQKLRLQMEEVGHFFVEFLKTRPGGPIPDVEVRLARAIESVGAGVGLADAFEKEVGVKLTTAQDELIAHMAATEGKTLERFRGTALEAFVPQVIAHAAALKRKKATPSPAPEDEPPSTPRADDDP